MIYMKEKLINAATCNSELIKIHIYQPSSVALVVTVRSTAHDMVSVGRYNIDLIKILRTV
jgi:hypothetical protein